MARSAVVMAAMITRRLVHLSSELLITCDAFVDNCSFVIATKKNGFLPSNEHSAKSILLCQGTAAASAVAEEASRPSRR